MVWRVHTTRVDGRPHVTPVLAVVDGDGIYFCTGPDEQKALAGRCQSPGSDGGAVVFEVRPEKIYTYDRDSGGATRFSFVP